MRRYSLLLFCLLILYASVFCTAVSADDSMLIKVGAYENQPKIFTDDDGDVSGLWADVIEYIASEEGWEIEYINGSWTQCLERLENNEIDIMPDVAYTGERDLLYDFSNEIVYTSWSRVYTREGVDIQSILGLDGKNVAVLESSVNVEGPEGIKILVSSFGVSCNFIEVDSYTGVFELVESGQADAGVVSKDFGGQHEAGYDVVKTAIIFQPSLLYFAFPKDSNLKPYLIERIDYHIKELKANEDSVYYQSLEGWLGVTTIEETVVPGWVKWLLLGIVGLVFLLTGGNFILRAHVRAKTKKLREEIVERKKTESALSESEEKYRNLVERANDGICIIQDKLVKYANSKQAEMWGGTVEEIINTPFINYIHPDELPVVIDRYNRRMAGEQLPSVYESTLRRKDGSKVYAELNIGIINYLGRPAEFVITRDITERKQAEERVIHLNSVLRALRNINQLITHGPDRERLIQESCNILVEERGYEKTWILLVDEKGKPVLVASAGIGDESFLGQMMSGEYPCCLKELVSQKELLLIYDRPGCQHKECVLSERHKERGVYRCRLEYGGRIYGAIGVTLPSALVADEEEQALFLELAGDISYALAAIERQEERRRAQEEIKMLARFPGENPSPVLRVARDGTILYANAASSLLLKKWRSKEGGVLNQHWREYISEVLDSGVVKSIETGCDNWVFLLRFAPIKEAGYVNIYGTDITERKQAEAALNEREVRFRELFQNMSSGVAIYEAVADGEDFIFKDFNRAAENIEKIKKEDVIGKSILEVFPGVKEFGLFDVLQRVWCSGEVEHFPVAFYSDERITGWRENYIYKLPSGEVVAIYDDITERRQAEEAIKASEEKLRLMFESISDSITVVDLNGNIVQTNEATACIHGYKNREELIGQPALNLIAKGDRPRVDKDIERVLEGETIGSKEYEFLTKDGKKFPGELRAALFKDISGNLLGTIVVAKDITERRQAEEAIKASEERYRTTLDGMLEGCQIIDFDWRYVYVNEVAARHGHQSRKKLLGRTMMEVYPGIEKTEIFTKMQQCMRERTSTRTENLFTYSDGSVGWFDLSIEPVPEGIFVLSLDVTERKKAEEAIANELTRRRILVDGSRDGIVVLEQDGKVYESNKRFAEMLGYSGEEVKKLCVWDWERHIPRKRLLGMLRSVDEAGDHFETQHRRKDGTIYDVEISTNAAVFSGQKLIFCVCRDITERKKSEEALRASEEKLRLMFEAINDGITIVNMNGEIIQANEAAARIHGYETGEELIGKTIQDFLPRAEHPDTTDYVRSTADKKYVVSNYEVNLLKKDGREFPAELSSSVIEDRNGKPMGLVSVFRDITERRQMEEQLLLTDRLASVGELASGIAHELNNPLTGVIGLTQLLVEGDAPENIRKDLEMVYSEAQRAAAVVKNLLAFSRKHPPAKQLLNINDVVNKVLELRAYEQKVSNIQLVDNMADGLPQITADYFQLQQVFLNIIINAEHFMIEEHGGGTLTITTERVDDMVRAYFVDDGPGIPRENLGHIFDPFFTTKEVGKGTGLGLSICHGIIIAHGGRIYAESEPGKGATFIVELPISQEEPSDEEQ